jgi:hypothetical protein
VVDLTLFAVDRLDCIKLSTLLHRLTAGGLLSREGKGPVWFGLVGGDEFGWGFDGNWRSGGANQRE